MAAPLQAGDELLGVGCVGVGAGSGLLEVVQGGAGIQEGVTDPAGTGQEQRDVVAGLPRSVDFSASFVVPEGLLVVAQRLAGVTGPAVDDAELVLQNCAKFMIVGEGKI